MFSLNFDERTKFVLLIKAKFGLDSPLNLKLDLDLEVILNSFLVRYKKNCRKTFEQSNLIHF